MIIIENYQDLLIRIEEYKRMFPNSYTTVEEIKKQLASDEFRPVGEVFGISVSSEWSDKCYGFEVDRQTPTTCFYRYLGIWKS